MPKTAIVTGAAGGIGGALAQCLGERGWRLTLVDLDDDRLQELEAELRSAGHPVQAVRADLSQEEEVDRVVDSALARWGRVGLCLPFAGVYVDPAEDPSEEVVEFVRAVNLDHPLRLISRSLDAADERGDGFTGVVPLSDAGLELRSDWVYGQLKAELHARSAELRSRIRGRPGQEILDVVVYPTETAFGQNSDAILAEQVGPEAVRPHDNREFEEFIQGTASPADVAEAIVEAVETGRATLYLEPKGRVRRAWLTGQIVRPLIDRAPDWVVDLLRVNRRVAA